jgi:hypothetical protein
MTQALTKKPIVNNDFMRLIVPDLQPPKTSQENFDILSDSRFKQIPEPRDDLTSQEIFDIKEYHSSSEKPKTFHNVNELLRDLHD